MESTQDGGMEKGKASSCLATAAGGPLLPSPQKSSWNQCTLGFSLPDRNRWPHAAAGLLVAWTASLLLYSWASVRGDCQSEGQSLRIPLLSRSDSLCCSLSFSSGSLGWENFVCSCSWESDLARSICKSPHLQSKRLEERLNSLPFLFHMPRKKACRN